MILCHRVSETIVLGSVFAVLLVLSSCHSLPEPMRDNDAGNLLSGACWRAAENARCGDLRAFHECFFAAYSRARDPMLGGEDLESIDLTLQRLLASVGDHAFASQLAAESPPIQSGAAWFLRSVDLQTSPETKAVVASARHFDFELERSTRRNQ
jgi:hypothetical protein